MPNIAQNFMPNNSQSDRQHNCELPNYLKFAFPRLLGIRFVHGPPFVSGPDLGLAASEVNSYASKSLILIRARI
jgi:hypothetical protein